MNKVMLMGRLTREPEGRMTTGEKPMAVTHYTLAVDRRMKRDNKNGEADFVNCVVFGKGAEFSQKYFAKGMRVAVVGHIKTGSYKNKDGQTVYTCDVIVDEQYFADNKGASREENGNLTDFAGGMTEINNPVREGMVAEFTPDGFLNIPEEIEDEGIPFQ